MKLFYCFLISSLLSVHFCQSQIPFKIKAGAARSNLGVDGDVQAHPIATWYGGVATTLRMGKRFFFQPELLYSQRGSNLRSSYALGNPTLIRRYGYISTPLLLGWHPFKKMSLLLGVEPGYMVWDRAKSDLYEHTYEDVDRRFNVDIDLGLAYQPLSRWTVEVRALAGMTGMYDQWWQSRTSVYTTGKHVGYHFMLQLGLSYDLKAKH
jgi:hypothetical protein